MSDYHPVRFGNNSQFYIPRQVVESLVLEKSSAKPAAGKFFSDYAQSSRAGIGPGQEKPVTTPSFGLLRAYRRASPIDRTIILKRMSQMKRVARMYAGEGSVGVAVRHVHYKDRDFEVPKELEALSKRLERQLLPNPTKPFHPHLRDFWVKAIQDELVIDRKVMVIQRDRAGRPMGYHAVDGATVKPIVAVLFEVMKAEFSKTSTVINAYQAVEKVYNSSGIDISNAAYVQVIDSKVQAAWRDDELSIDITNPTSETNYWGYGESALEQSLQFTEVLLNIYTYNNELFKLNYPESILMITGDYDTEALNSMKASLLGNGTASNWRLPVFVNEDENAKMQVVKTRDTPKDMQFMDFWHSMVGLKTAAFNMPPSLINIDGTLGKDPVVEGSHDPMAADIALDEGAKALVESMCDWLSCLVIPHHPDLRVVVLGLEPENEQARIEMISKKAWMSPNEQRIEDGQAPIDKIPENPADIPPAMLQQMQVLNSMKQQEQQAQQAQQQQAQGQAQQMPNGYDQGDFGDDPWGMDEESDDQQPDSGQAPQPLQKSRPRYLHITVEQERL